MYFTYLCKRMLNKNFFILFLLFTFLFGANREDLRVLDIRHNITYSRVPAEKIESNNFPLNKGIESNDNFRPKNSVRTKARTIFFDYNFSVVPVFIVSNFSFIEGKGIVYNSIVESYLPKYSRLRGPPNS